MESISRCNGRCLSAAAPAHLDSYDVRALNLAQRGRFMACDLQTQLNAFLLDVQVILERAYRKELHLSPEIINHLCDAQARASYTKTFADSAARDFFELEIELRGPAGMVEHQGSIEHMSGWTEDAA